VTIVTAAIASVLVGVGVFLVLQRTLSRIILGLVLFANAANLLLIIAGGPSGRPPLVGRFDEANPPADPLPQALALTAIVIAFGITAFLLSLAYRSWVLTHDDEVEDDIEDRRIAALGEEEFSRWWRPKR
jgi:multicomponent Na+:H+ antiporter subunit C